MVSRLKAIPPEKLCLICGDEQSDSVSDRISCSEENCSYAAHESCCIALGRVVNDSSMVSLFCCKRVVNQLRPSEVDDCLGSPESLLLIREVVRRRGKTDPKSYTPRRKRYMNPNVECERCGKQIPINEEDHLLTNCSARSVGTPVPSRDYEYVSMKFKRIRLMALYDYPP